MTPDQKADCLINRIYDEADCSIVQAAKVSLICVEEFIKSIKPSDELYSYYNEVEETLKKIK